MIPRHVETEPEPPEALRDGRNRNRALRRERVYAAAIRLFVEQGFESTTMEDISERASVARATVFNHFQRKSAFLDEWSARRRRRALDAVRAARRGDHSLKEVLTQYMIELADSSESARDETVALIGSAIRSTDAFGNTYLARELTELVEQAQRSGEVRAEVDAAQAGLIIATSYFAILERWITDPPPFHLRAALLGMLDLVFHGLIPPASDSSGRPAAP
ncbi:TetR/AcrR family transcriptional regulator [Micromonospora sp. NPDC048830]|uniref:TetR/AcrR family transcriptional regulator n=1 Tax=Micromonospora sp. NPDC048830 TaxID=3364257 RepID=UPI00371157EE